MRHASSKVTLDRKKAQREALLRSLAESIILREKVVTTLAKAKAVRPFVEKMVTRAKKNTLHDKREILKVAYTKNAMRKLTQEIAPRYAQRPGGYTRITKMPPRRGDGADMALIEFV